MKIELNLLPYQMEMLKSESKYLGFIGGTGTGKTFMVPTWLISKMSNYPNNEWIISAPTTMMMKRTIIKYTLGDFDKWRIPYEYNKTDMIVEMGLGTIYFISADTPDRMQGIHPKGIVGDEAGLYDNLWWQTALQRISFKSGQILLTTTPYNPNHWLKLDFWDKWKAGDKDFTIVNPISLDNPFYPKDEYYRAKRKMPKWRFDLMYDAKFPEQSSKSLFKYDEIDKCIEVDENIIYDKTEDKEKYLTIDVAREGNDQSVICEWIGCVLKRIYKYDTNTLTELVGSTKMIAGEDIDKYTIIVDSSGLGAGVYDMMYENGWNVYGVNFAQSPYDDAYANARAEMYHNLADAIEKVEVKLLDDDFLKDDLIVQERNFNSRGKIGLVPKEKIKEKIGRSPDISDAVALRFSSFKSNVGMI